MENEVISVFDKISEKYDLLDTMISWGMDQHWRKEVIRLLKLKNGLNVLDCGAGTGKLSSLILKKCHDCNLTIVDLNEKMLRRDLFPNVKFHVGSAEELPLEDSSQDRVTSAFLTRNVPRLERYLSEAYRVLDHDGIFVNLDIFNPTIPVYRDLFGLYFFKVVPRFGNMVTGSTSYTYLANSVKKFVSPGTFSRMLELAGFTKVYHQGYMLGAVNIHVGIKS